MPFDCHGQHYPGLIRNANDRGPIPDLLHQKLWGWGLAICVLTSSPSILMLLKFEQLCCKPAWSFISNSSSYRATGTDRWVWGGHSFLFRVVFGNQEAISGFRQENKNQCLTPQPGFLIQLIPYLFWPGACTVNTSETPNLSWPFVAMCWEQQLHLILLTPLPRVFLLFLIWTCIKFKGNGINIS